MSCLVHEAVDRHDLIYVTKWGKQMIEDRTYDKLILSLGKAIIRSIICVTFSAFSNTINKSKNDFKPVQCHKLFLPIVDFIFAYVQDI